LYIGILPQFFAKKTYSNIALVVLSNIKRENPLKSYTNRFDIKTGRRPAGSLKKMKEKCGCYVFQD